MRRALALVLLVLAGWFGAATPAAACTSGGCLSAGPRLASVSSTRGPLLNALLNTLGGGSISLSAVDWNTIASGDVSLAKTLSALQASTNASTPSAALSANATIAQVIGAMAIAAQQDTFTSLAAALGNLQPQVSLPTAIHLGDLLVSDGVLGSTRINALSVVTGMIQLYNKQNVASTPQAISLTGTTLGLAGVLNSVQLQAQVVEAPVYVCGPAGSSFHTAAIRVKLHLDLVSIGVNLGVLNTSASVGQIDLYLEIARADGTLNAVDAIANTLTVGVTPGVAALYAGTIADNLFFNRTRAIVAADVTPGTIGSLSLLGTTVAIRAKSIVVGPSPSATQLNFSGSGLQTHTAYTTANFGANLVGSLIDNLQLSLSPSGVLDSLLSALTPALTATVKPVLTGLLTTLIDPTLEMLGIRLGEVDVTSGGTILACTISGTVYQDSNHSGGLDSGESGTGVPLYAKLVALATPTVASAVTSIDPANGAYLFASVLPAVYTVVISTDGTSGSVAALGPTGWVATESPTLKRSVTVSNRDLSAQRFGLYHGSTLQGTVFKDNGNGTGGIPNNGLRDGSEAAIGAATLKLTNAAGTTTYDSTTSDANGAYTLWLPSGTDGAALKVAQVSDATVWTSVSGSAGTSGGSYSVASDSVAFTHVGGSAYLGVDFGDVPVNRLDSDGQLVIRPGTTVLFPHAFKAGSAGQLTLATGAIGSAPAGWSALVFRDLACNGQLDAGDSPVAAPIALAADQSVCLIVKVFAPANAALGTRYPVSVSASFAYTNSSQSGTLQRQDVATVGDGDLQLQKAVDKASAGSGELIAYTIAFRNLGAGTLTALTIRDATPAYTVFASASCGAVPAGLACSVTIQPAANGAGSVEWTLTGALASGGVGQVQFSVKVN